MKAYSWAALLEQAAGGGDKGRLVFWGPQTRWASEARYGNRPSPPLRPPWLRSTRNADVCRAEGCLDCPNTRLFANCEHIAVSVLGAAGQGFEWGLVLAWGGGDEGAKAEKTTVQPASALSSLPGRASPKSFPHPRRSLAPKRVSRRRLHFERVSG